MGLSLSGSLYLCPDYKIERIIFLIRIIDDVNYVRI